MGILSTLFKREYEATCSHCATPLYLVVEEVESGKYRCPVCGRQSDVPAEALRRHAQWKAQQERKRRRRQRVWVSRESHIYHLPSCTHAARISWKNRVILRSPLQAKAAGYYPCSFCKPPIPAAEPSNKMKSRAKARTESRRGRKHAPARKSPALGSGRISIPLPRNLTAGKTGKLWKLLTYKTRRGKTNILIDLLCHGHGRLGYLLDQVLHTINEGALKPGKFIRYGNFRRILGLPSFSRLFWRLFKF